MTEEDINDIVNKYDKLLKLEGVVSQDFAITDNLVRIIFFKYIYPTTKLMYLKKNRNSYKSIATQLNYTRLSLLRVKYHRNGDKAIGIKEGYVYIVSNKAWPDKYKIGSTISIPDRLKTYQSYSPHRDYVFECYFFSSDRRSIEREFHVSLDADHEWIQTHYTDGKSSKLAVVELFKLNKLKDMKSLTENIEEFVT